MKLLVLDGNSIINRAFYAIRLLSTKEGLFTNGIFGFINILEKAMNDEKPDGVVVAFDLSAPTFRHEQYDKYKAQRKGMPDELALQMPLLKEILDKMDISRIELAGYEADDLIGTIAAKCETDGVECVILTGDRDDLQLVNEKTVCVLASTSFGRAESKRYTPELIQQEYGFEPANIVDMKALWGDTSDNIPGVRGVGEKTAKDLIKRFGTVEKIYDNIESTEIKESVRKKLVEGRDMAFMSKKLATICKNVPAQINLEDYIIKNPDYEALLALYTKLEFRTLAEKLRVKLEKEEKQNLAQAEIPEIITVGSLFELMGIAGEFKSIYIDFAYDMLCVYDGQKIYSILRENLCDDYENAVSLVFENDAEKTVFDIKSICNALKHYKVLSKNCTFDVLLAGYLLNPSAPGYSLIDLISTYVGTGYEDIPAQRAFALCAMRSAMQKKLDETGMSDLYKNIELPLAMVLFDMENTGFKLDREALLTWGENLKSESNEIAKLIYDLAGEEFNINSPKQLGEILFQKLKIPAGKKTKTGYRTDADTLEGLRLQYPIVELILKYRQISKLSSTYADGFLKV
ncbi:MAG: DNA polymerase, partial [Bacillota bacterium]|nr:DNA polymerase [Bacillota bacterium]